MFRFLRPPRTILSMSRLPLRLEAHQQRGQAVNVQKVHFNKQRPRPKSIALSFLAFYLCLEAYWRVVLIPLDEAATEASTSLPEEIEDDTKPLFIPFPGTTRMLKSKPYRGNDPEWQEFIKISKDIALTRTVRRELADYVVESANKHPILAARCGRGMTLRRYWLDIDFPVVAPPEFERSGIALGPDYIGWAKQPVDSLTVSRIQSALWPSALMQSIWTFTKVFVVDDIKRIAGMLGFKSGTPPPSIEELIAQHQKLMKNGRLPNKQGSPQLSVPSDPMKAITSASGTQNSPVTGKKSDEIEVEESASAFEAHLFRAIWAFKNKLFQTWRPVSDLPPRGSILVSGLVEVESPKAWLVLDVQGAWDPSTKSYHSRSLILKLRRLQMKRQGPVG